MPSIPALTVINKIVEHGVEVEYLYNNRMHSDSKKRRSFLALLFAAGDAKR